MEKHELPLMIFGLGFLGVRWVVFGRPAATGACRNQIIPQKKTRRRQPRVLIFRNDLEGSFRK